MIYKKVPFHLERTISWPSKCAVVRQVSPDKCGQNMSCTTLQYNSEKERILSCHSCTKVGASGWHYYIFWTKPPFFLLENINFKHVIRNGWKVDLTWFCYSIFDRSLVEAVQGIAFSGDFRLPFAQIWDIFSLFHHVFILGHV